MNRILVMLKVCIAVLSLAGFLAAGGVAHSASCDTQKDGVAVVSPTNVEFFSYGPGSLQSLGTQVVQVNGFAYSVDDGCATTHTWGETTDFCWVATKDQSWLRLNGTDTGIVRNRDGQGQFTIGINAGLLEEYLNAQPTRPSLVRAKVTITTTLSGTPTIEVPVVVHLDSTSIPGCDPSKEGALSVSPAVLTFYVSAQDTTDPVPKNVDMKGLVYINDSGDATQAQTTSFCWIVSSSTDWIRFVGSTSGVLRGMGDGYRLQVTIDRSRLPVPQEVYLSGGSMSYEGNITIITNLSQGGTTILPVKVYVNSLRTVEEESVSTSRQVSIPLNIPISQNVQGALYILVEHPRLLPYEVYSYRHDANLGPRFDLFSKHGRLVDGAGLLYYAPDIQGLPAVNVPYSSAGHAYPPAPYQQYDLSPPTGDVTMSDIKGYLPVSLGEGISLHGLEGDIIVRALVGDPARVQDWRAWKELLYKVIHVFPVTGTWIVTDEIDGEKYTYSDDRGNTYPLVLHEENGVITGQWLLPGEVTNLTVRYLERPEGGYEISFREPSDLYGMVDYVYRIESFEGSGYLQGTWQYRLPDSDRWSMPNRFTAVRQEVVVPLDPECNCYMVDGEVNGYPMRFYVDTGAAVVFLASDIAQYMGVDLDDPARCWEGEAEGVGGTVTVKYCLVDIEIEGRLRKNGVLAAFSDTWSGPGLLGMTFLDSLHVSKSSDGTMILAP